MPKILIVRLLVPSGSRAPAMKHWLQTLLAPHRMEALTVAEELTDLKTFPDGKPKPFLPAARYDELRDDDRFLYNRSPE